MRQQQVSTSIAPPPSAAVETLRSPRDEAGPPAALPNVAFYSPTWQSGAAANGVVTYTRHLVGALRAEGVKPFILSRRTDAADASARLVASNESSWTARLVGKLPLGPLADRVRQKRFSRALLAEVRRLHAEERLELLEIEESFGRAAVVAPRARLPVVVRLHGPWFVVGPLMGARDDRKFRWRVRAEAEGIAAAAAVSAPSRDVLGRVREAHGLELRESQVIPNPVPPVPVEARWRPGDAERGHILFVGRFDACKGGDLIIDALPLVAREFPGCRLTFIGPDRGLCDERGTHHQVREYINRLGALRERVQWLGVKGHDEITQFRRIAWVTVVCSRYENFPMVALEAMAAGCPLVASRVGGLPEIVQDGRNGLLCNGGDAAALAASIAALLRNEPLAVRLGAQAALDCEQRYHPHVVAKQTLEFYRRVIERWRSRSGDRNGHGHRHGHA